MQLDIFYTPISCVNFYLLDNATLLLSNNDFQMAASQFVVVSNFCYYELVLILFR